MRMRRWYRFQVGILDCTESRWSCNGVIVFDSGALCLYEFVLMTTLGVETFKMKSYLRQTVLHSAPESERITPQSSGTVFLLQLSVVISVHLPCVPQLTNAGGTLFLQNCQPLLACCAFLWFCYICVSGRTRTYLKFAVNSLRVILHHGLLCSLHLFLRGTAGVHMYVLCLRVYDWKWLTIANLSDYEAHVLTHGVSSGSPNYCALFLSSTCSRAV